MPAHEFPAEATPFVGRQHELTTIASLLNDPMCRLVSLVGPGGMGKTRLALQAARQDEHAFAAGTVFVPLQTLSSPEFLVPTLAQAFDLEFYPGTDPKQQLLDYLRDKILLLVLDNFEHLMDGVELLSEMLMAAPGIKLLVTSREPLHLVEEWVLEVEGLTYPAHNETFETGDYAAVELFLQSARRAHTAFELAPAQRSAVVRICQMVRGMPLGIELTSAWVRALTCEQIAVELERSLDILETPARNVPPRHRTMRAAFDPTWQRLSEAERTVFKQLSVFRGGFTLEAAQAVTGASLRTLSTLVDRSLLRIDAKGRYDLHELLRQYGEEQLDLSAEECEATCHRHAAYFAAFVSRRWEDMQGPLMVEGLDLMEREVKNAEAAWSYALSTATYDDLWLLMPGLFNFYYVRTDFEEGRTVGAQAIQVLEGHKAGRERDELLACVLAYHAFLSGIMVRHEAETGFQQSRALLLKHDALGSRREMLHALTILGWTVRDRRPLEAKELCEQSVALCRQFGYVYELEWALFILASIYMWVFEDYEEGKPISQEAFELARQLEHPMGIACGCWLLGQIAYHQARYSEAKQLQLEALRYWTALGSEQNKRTCYVYLGEIAVKEGDYQEARHWYSVGLVVRKDTFAAISLPAMLIGIASLLVAKGNAVLAAELCAFVLKQPTSQTFNPKSRAETLLRELETQLPATAVAAALERGQARTFEDTVKYVLDTLRNPLGSAQHERGTPEHYSLDRLTVREREVLVLLGEGLSNQQIAERLVLSVGTVKWYVSQIYSKLHAENRVQALTRARELNLLP